MTRSGYPNRFRFEQFVKQYGFLAHKKNDIIDRRKVVAEICVKLADLILSDPAFTVAADAMGSSNKLLRAGIQRGKTMIFLRAGSYHFLEKIRATKLRGNAVKIQSMIRRCLCRSRYVWIRRMILILQCASRRFIAYRKVRWLRHTRASYVLQRIWRGHKARRRVRCVWKGLLRLQAMVRSRIARRLVIGLRQHIRSTCIAAFYRGCVYVIVLYILLLLLYVSYNMIFILFPLLSVASDGDGI